MSLNPKLVIIGRITLDPIDAKELLRLFCSSSSATVDKFWGLFISIFSNKVSKDFAEDSVLFDRKFDKGVDEDESE